MKNEIDSLGRFVIPISYRRKMNLSNGDELDMRLEKDSLIIKKAYPSCIFCKNNQDLIDYEDKILCSNCIEKISQLKK